MSTPGRSQKTIKEDVARLAKSSINIKSVKYYLNIRQLARAPLHVEN